MQRLLGFEVSHRPDKKFNAIVFNTLTGRIRRIPFGQRGSTTYQNKTGVGRVATHHDKVRRDNYRRRHHGEGLASKKYTPGWFAWHYLW